MTQNRLREKLRLCLVVCLLAGAFEIGSVSASGQTTGTNAFGAAKGRLLETAPHDETFKVVEGLVVSWHMLGCRHLPDDRPEHGCGKVEYSSEFQRSSTFSIFDREGSIWWRASLLGNDEYREAGVDYFWTKRKRGFEPFALDHPVHASGMLLRIVGESSNWYEVEINETTRETKFVKKDDAAWSKTSWDFWLAYGRTLTISPRNEVRDRPNGNFVEPLGEYPSKEVDFVRAEDDWALVSDSKSRSAGKKTGWIRWRKNRNILVGCFFNQNRLPQ